MFGQQHQDWVVQGCTSPQSYKAVQVCPCNLPDVLRITAKVMMAIIPRYVCLGSLKAPWSNGAVLLKHLRPCRLSKAFISALKTPSLKLPSRKISVLTHISPATGQALPLFPRLPLGNNSSSGTYRCVSVSGMPPQDHEHQGLSAEKVPDNSVQKQSPIAAFFHFDLIWTIATPCAGAAFGMVAAG